MINATQLKLMTDAMAVSARVEGMKANNAKALIAGNYPEYDFNNFDMMACELEQLGQSILECAS